MNFFLHRPFFCKYASVLVGALSCKSDILPKIDVHFPCYADGFLSLECSIRVIVEIGERPTYQHHLGNLLKMQISGYPSLGF